MKTLLLLLITITTATASEYRLWFDAKTGRSIQAAIVDKNTDEAKLRLKRTGKAVWVKTARLAEEDQRFIASWIKPRKVLTVRLAGSKKGGYKKIRVKTVAGNSAVKVNVTSRGYRTTTYTVDAGTTSEAVYTVKDAYIVTASANNGSEWITIDTETNKRKTGL